MLCRRKSAVCGNAIDGDKSLGREVCKPEDVSDWGDTACMSAHGTTRKFSLLQQLRQLSGVELTCIERCRKAGHDRYCRKRVLGGGDHCPREERIPRIAPWAQGRLLGIEQRYSWVPDRELNLTMCNAIPWGSGDAASTIIAVQNTNCEVAKMNATPELREAPALRTTSSKNAFVKCVLAVIVLAERTAAVVLPTIAPPVLRTTNWMFSATGLVLVQ
jgi:hypothetical protein